MEFSLARRGVEFSKQEEAFMPTPLALVRRWFLLLLPWSAENLGPDDATRDGVQRHVLRIHDKIPLDQSTSRRSKNNTFSVAREIIATGLTNVLLLHNYLVRLFPAFVYVDSPPRVSYDNTKSPHYTTRCSDNILVEAVGLPRKTEPEA